MVMVARSSFGQITRPVSMVTSVLKAEVNQVTVVLLKPQAKKAWKLLVLALMPLLKMVKLVIGF